VPREKTGAEKEKKYMIEEIKAGQTNQEQSKKVGLGQDGAGVALRDADRRPMVLKRPLTG
jgi:hypothetical protein